MSEKRTIVIRDELRRQRALNVVREIKIDSERPMEMLLQEFQSTRTLAQNRLLWWWMAKIRKHVLESEGKFYSDKQLYHYFCEMFLPQVVERTMGKIVERQRTSSELNVKEFTEFLTSIEQHCFDQLNFVLPRPEDMYHLAMGKAA